MPEEITDSQDELSLDGIFRDLDQVHVPIFQRGYVWKNKELKSLLEDMNEVLEGQDSLQFLGAIIGYERPRPRSVVGRLRAIDVVDGQQRVLTMYMFVMAIVELSIPGDLDFAVQIAKDYLLLEQRSGLTVTTRIVPSLNDHGQFIALWQRLYGSDGFRRELGKHFQTLPAPAGNAEGPLTAQYKRIVKYLRGHVDDLPRLLDLVTERLVFVSLELKDASAAPTIFARLNDRGKRVSIVDLVRNEVFSRVAEEPELATKLFRQLWEPFEEGLGGRAEQFFFPYCLVETKGNTRKSEIFRGLRGVWKGLGPEEIIGRMEPYRDPFLGIDQGQPVFESSALNLRMDRLNRLGTPSALYPFLMALLTKHEDGRRSPLVDILDLVESFLVRRAIVGFEPTGLHALFKGVWWEIEKGVSTEALTKAIRKRGTIQWPDDDEVRRAVLRRRVATTRVCRYLLVEYDRSLPGDDPDCVPTIEHVLPNSREGESAWASTFTAQEHRTYKDVWANLVPLSAPLNSSLQQGPYEEKRRRYADESMFVTPRRLAAEWTEWTPETIENRGKVLGEWAIRRWPHGGAAHGVRTRSRTTAGRVARG